MWMAILSFLVGPLIKGLINAYQAKLKAGNIDSKIAADLAASEIAAQTLETQSLTQLKIAEIGHPWEPKNSPFTSCWHSSLSASCGTRSWVSARHQPLRVMSAFGPASSCRFTLVSARLKTSRGSSSDDRGDHQAMTTARDDYIKVVVAETLAEQQRLHHEDIDAVVLKAMATILTSFGIEDEDRRELRADLQHLRRWRRSVEQAQTDTTDNVASANNFIRAGYRLYRPQHPWAWPNTLYWRKSIR
jgi:hypothetical protein